MLKYRVDDQLESMLMFGCNIYLKIPTADGHIHSILHLADILVNVIHHIHIRFRDCDDLLFDK